MVPPEKPVEVGSFVVYNMVQVYPLWRKSPVFSSKFWQHPLLKNADTGEYL